MVTGVQKNRGRYMVASSRTVSIAISYILLVVVATIADVLLVSTYVGFVSRSIEWVPRIVHEISQGVVYGVYMMSPCVIEVRENNPLGRTVTYNVTLPCLHISIVNPNPVPTEVILLGHVSSPQFTRYQVLDLLASFNLYWDTRDGNPPPGVSIVNPSWLVEPIGSLGPGIYRAIRMNPGASASFRIPLTYSGAPSEVLACTRVGCTKLHTVGAQTISQSLSTTWILYPSDHQQQTPQDVQIPSATYSVTQTWKWRAVTLGGPPISCQLKLQHLLLPMATIIATYLGGKCCGFTCSPDTVPIQHPPRNEVPRGECDIKEGYIVSPSALLGYPPRILVGFFTTDQNFEFKVIPSVITIDGKRYNLYGFDSSNYNLIPSQYGFVIGTWSTYDHKECHRRVITLTTSIFVDPSKSVPLSTIYRNSRKLYIYGATRGYVESSSIFFARYDNVKITVTGRYITKNNIEKVVVIADRISHYESGYVSLDMDGLVEVTIDVIYEMIGEEPFYCYIDYLIGTYCGRNYDRHVRLVFYIELIPDEILR